VENVVNRFLDDIRNPYILKNTIQYYNSIFGSTCQQSAKFKKMDISATSKFDYVIIDEASRVNPVDLLIPMTMGHKIILVGDQKQLPHYLERGNVKVLAEKVKSKNEVLYEVLKESLFERIFNLLEKESKFKRTITLLEQYRMNPILGKFISDNFYDGIIKNGVGVEKKVNNYGICDNKSVAWIDIDKSFGTEVRNHSGSLYRNAEVIAILDSLSKLSKNFYDDLSKFPMVGVISYYKAQTEIIKERIISKFPSHIIDKITVGTVDSFQGKEFDVVYLSTVRANANSDIRERIGFLSDNPNRINVSMSRAKNLMVIVGDSDTLAKNSKSIINKYFNNFLEVCEAEGYYAQKEV
jgi:superfamily I DNA and/or RNA helicase